MGERVIELALDGSTSDPVVVRVPGEVVLRESTERLPTREATRDTRS
jgi:hypothetical protein